jgi:hypothetical protein
MQPAAHEIVEKTRELWSESALLNSLFAGPVPFPLSISQKDHNGSHGKEIVLIIGIIPKLEPARHRTLPNHLLDR